MFFPIDADLPKLATEVITKPCPFCGVRVGTCVLVIAPSFGRERKLDEAMDDHLVDCGGGVG